MTRKRNPSIRKKLNLVAASGLLAWGTAALGGVTLVIDNPEMAGIHGHPDYWDRPVTLAEDGATRVADHGRHGGGPVADWSTEAPGAPVFDAVHRSLLVRFPDAAERIAEALGEGKRIVRAEIVFEHAGTEFFPMHYRMPSGMSFLGDLWVRKPPRWHAVAWALREPWKADVRRGPTFNAAVHGHRYWARFGAEDSAADRQPHRFGPTEVSEEVSNSRMDVTGALADPAFGASLGERLRHLSERGFLVRKWETYDALYNHGGYEYGGAPGHRGILVRAPKLVVTLEPGGEGPVELPTATDPFALPRRGSPTAVLPDEATIRGYIARFAHRQPEDMPLWQYRRIEELLELDGRGEGGFPKTVEAYHAWVRAHMETPYRQFLGHHTPLSTHDVLLYASAMPAPMLEHMRRYWDAWLMPGRTYHDLAHNQWGIWTREEDSYYARTGDWRGNHSFYRASYTRYMSTMNFNHKATMGALLGGAVAGNQEALDDGRFGLETILLRLWSWYDGTTQESIDHYYLGLTLASQKAFADLGPTVRDRVIGQSMLVKTMDELVGCYHPALKRFVSTSGRTGIAHVLTINEGLNAILHTVSRKGALHNIGNPDRLGSPIHGHDLPPALVANQALVGPWMPLWMGRIVDDKPLPFELTSTFKVWGAQREHPLWKRSYLGRYYGLSTRDLASAETVPSIALWRREPGDTAHLQEVGALFLRYGVNQTEFFDTVLHGEGRSNANGSVGIQGGYQMALQHKNKAVVLLSPFSDLKVQGRKDPEAVHSFQGSIALANYQDSPTWTLYVNGQPANLSALPLDLEDGSRIVIHDGASYIGLIPIPATDFGRKTALRITDGGEPVGLQGGGRAAPTLVLNNYNYFDPDNAFPYGEALLQDEALSARVARAVSGFVIEMGDTAEYSDLEAFLAHVDAAALNLRWDADADMLHVDYRSGEDRLEMGVRPHYEGARWGARIPATECFVYRRVNGQWPYLPEGLERDTTVSQQGRTGRLEKGGAALTFQPGRMGYLLTDPVGGHVLFANPLPDPQYMVMDAPGGMRLKADGALGLLHCLVHPAENRIEIQYAADPAPADSEMAAALYVFGCSDEPSVTLNREPIPGLALVKLENRPAWRIPLHPAAPTPSAEAMAARYERSSLSALAAMSTLSGTEARMEYLTGQEHYILREPARGVYSFWRQWPNPSPVRITLPEGVRVAIDGNLALQRIDIHADAGRIDVDYAPYLQMDRDGNPIQDRARGLLVFGLERPPAVTLHGKPYEAAPEAVTVAGESAWLVPLFGEPPAAIGEGLDARLANAMRKLDE